MSTATPANPAVSPSELLRSVSPAERLKLLRELVKLCFADRSLNKPLQVTDEKDTHVGIIAAMYPRTTKPLPVLTEEERIELQRRIDNRHNAMSEEEFLAAVRKRIKERAESAES